MPKRGAVALVTTILALLLLFGFRTGDQVGLAATRPIGALTGSPRATQPGPVGVVATPGPSSTVAGVAGSPGSPATRAPATSAPATPAPATASGTFTGDVIRTPYGPVQVAVVMKGGKIVDVQSLQLPSDRRLSQQISEQAGPLLRSQVLRAQSADISGVSGASYTSQGYYDSLQSALAQVP